MYATLLKYALFLTTCCFLGISPPLAAADDLRLIYTSGSETWRTPLPNGTSATTTVDSSQNFEVGFVANGAPGLRTPFGLSLGYTDMEVSAGGVLTQLEAWYARGSLGVGYWYRWIGIEASGFVGAGLADIQQRNGFGFRASDDPWYYEYGAQAWLTAGVEPGIVIGVGGTWVNAPIEADLGHGDDDFTRNGFSVGAFLAIRIE
jgi:hypothetical protein